MKVLINITEELFKRIQRVNKSSSLSSFILVAIENQISLERENDGDLIDFDEKTLSVPRLPDENSKLLEKPPDIKSDIVILNKILDYEKIVEIPLNKPIKNYYIWGQYNKFFAMKFAVRYLAYLQLQNNSAPVNLTDFQTECSKAASMMKQILKQSDEKAGRVWGQGFSAGLPESEDKSRSRFNQQFIGYMDSKGNQVGALSDIGFIVINDNKVGLSSYGSAFAKIHNPILDETPLSSSLFSSKERDFLIDHIKIQIPTEWEGIKSVLYWIDVGINTPETLNEKFATMDPNWTEKMANTYRTGMLARISDLGFIIRKRKGVNVNYLVTDFGKSMEGKS